MEHPSTYIFVGSAVAVGYLVAIAASALLWRAESVRREVARHASASQPARASASLR